ncbi:MAG: ABC transporter ATP-binding protein, partial [Nitriliruptorales bacterium]
LALLAVPVRLVGYLTWEIAHSVAGWERVEEILSITDVIRYGELPAATGDGGAAVTGTSVEFGYEPGVPVIGGLELDVPAGRTLALVGPTASGKSTLAQLLARLWDPDSGAIRLDGRDLRDLGRGVVPGEVAFVSQNTFLFDDTVEGNITLGLDVDQADVDEAVRLAGADTFVEDLPNGYDTRVGERGATLSGGQQQRIALARALVRRPRLLVLDDATSAVDPSVEADILRGLKHADLPSTVLVVAYRRSSIVLADEVIYIEGGRIAAHGTHGELMRNQPGYVALLTAYEDDAATTRSR